MSRPVTGFPASTKFERKGVRVGLALAAGIALIAMFAIASRHSATTPETETRNVSLRLSGFGWRPYRRSGSPALATLAAPQRGTSPAGVTDLLIGEPQRALERLSQASESSNDPRIWNDFAVAAYETAERREKPELLTDALAAADRALVLQPDMAEALFNRAAILQRLGLRDDARAAWECFLLHENNTGWLTEARERLRGVQPVPSFLDTLDRHPERLNELVRDDPQSARLDGSIDVLARWAKTRAGQHLDLARELGARIAARNGDRTLEQAVYAIDLADDPARQVLAEAHVLFLEGTIASRNNRPGDAEVLLKRAADAFARGKSPLAFAAREAAARMMYEQSRDAEAHREHESLLRELPASFPALRAHSHWQLGVLDASAGRWGPALSHLAESTAAFGRLGESDHASRVERVIAVAYDRIGDSDNAWKHRMIALQGVGRTSSLALEKSVATMAHAEMYKRKWRVAESLLNLEIDIATRMRDDLQLGDALLYRGAVRHELGDDAGARRDADDAEAVVARLNDPAYRAFFQTDAQVLRARLEPMTPRALALLTSAIDFMAVKGDGMDLPRLLLQRARLFRKIGDNAAAAADLRRGMDELEKSRESLPRGESRWGVFHSHEELFEEAVDLAVDEGEAATALAFAERARARSLLDTYGHTDARFDPAQLPSDTALVEVNILPHRTVLIVAERAATRIVTVDVERAALAAEIEAFLGALNSGDAASAKRQGAGLFRRLVAPLGIDAKQIVFVPDNTSSPIPFGALSDSRGVYLIERRSVVVAPSAAVFLAASQRRDPARPRSVLIVSNDESDTPLPNVNAETRGVAGAYPVAREIHDAADLRHANSADVIHFAGHAVGDEHGFEPASILLRENGAERRMNVAEIAKLQLSKAQVVVLAGCSTARGQRRGTEGAISVAYGFLTAGAPSVIATLWPIDDQAASRFFPRLHRLLATGLAPAEALREVQIDAIRRGDVPASLWASLQDIGS